MPERPKRRKNNKNKRKNKNNRPDLNKNDSDVKETLDTELCSVNNIESCDDNKTIEDKPTNESVESVPLAENTLVTENQTKRVNACNDTASTSQDLNNNRNNEQICNDSVVTDSSEQNHVDETIFENEISQKYVVESPDQSLRNKSKRNKSKLGNTTKSKSLDNDDAPKIVELTEEESNMQSDDNTLAIIDCSNVLVSDVESDVEWEKTDDITEKQEPECKEIATEKMTVTTIPLNIAKCDQAKSLTPEEELSLRHYLQTLNLATQPGSVNSVEIKTEIEQIINREIRHRLRKKGLAEDFFSQRLGPPRILDVIDEEGSSESSMTSRRQSYLSDKKSDNEDLEDDVFEDPKKVKEKFSTKAVSTFSNKTFGQLVPQQCVLVGAKLKEPEVTEARGDWSVKTIEKMTGAEVVYLTDSSSSTSSIYDVGEETNDGGETDVSVRMITPTIEVTDTENLLKKSFLSKTKDDSLLDGSDVVNIQEIKQETSTKSEANDKNIFNNNSNITPSSHEIVVLSTDNIKTNLYVKDLSEIKNNENIENGSKITDISSTSDASVIEKDKNFKIEKSNNEFDLEIKVLKCELNDAINNLIKEVVSDSESGNENPKEIFTRQDSSSSVCSSQCTAKYNPTYSSLNDVSNIHEETSETNKENTDNTQSLSGTNVSHVKDVFERVTGLISTHSNSGIKFRNNQPLALREYCVRKIASFPYGDKILEELASVSQRLQNISIIGRNSNDSSLLTKRENIEIMNNDTQNKQLDKEKQREKMQYFLLPDISTTEKVSLAMKQKDTVPPPIQPRNSSLKKSQDDHWTGLPTKKEPVYVCLSPSQKMLMEKTNTVFTKEDATQHFDMHKNLVDQRSYNEYYDKEDKNLESTNETPIVPFKSQTGSRLLALIRDPSVTSNMNSLTSKHNHKSLDQLEKTHTYTESTSKKNSSDLFNSVKNLPHIFKPIPPPRPRKYSSSFYESDESSDFTDNSFRSMKSERKFFHYSTGNLSKEIENDISSIQNMHRHYTNVRDQILNPNCPRRPSLPKDLCAQQMEYIRQKEKEVDAEIQRVEKQKLNSLNLQKKGPRAPLISEKDVFEEKVKDANNYYKSHYRDVAYSTKHPDKNECNKLSSLFSCSQEEILRDKMYSEYINQIAERQERKQQKIIKITNTPPTTSSKSISKSMSALDILDSKVNNRIEKEFILKARDRWNKLGIRDPETEDERDGSRRDVYREPKVIEHKIKVIEGGEERDVQKLPNHLQEFVRFTVKDKEQGSSSPGESPRGPASPHVVILCAVIILVLAVGKYFLRLLRNK